MSKNVTNHPKIVLEWGKPLGDKEKPYAYRWRIDFYWFSFRIHKWMCSDDERAYHSHPTNMLIFILYGFYIDCRPERSYYRNGPCIYRLRRDTRHYVKIPQLSWGHRPVLSFVFTWGAPQRWAFWDKITGRRYTRDKYFKEKGNHICE